MLVSVTSVCPPSAAWASRATSPPSPSSSLPSWGHTATFNGKFSWNKFRKMSPQLKCYQNFPSYHHLNFSIWVTSIDWAIFQDHNLSPESPFSCHLRPSLPCDDPHRHLRRRLLLPIHHSLPALLVPPEVRADVLGDVPDHVHLHREVAGGLSAPVAQDSLPQVRHGDVRFSSQFLLYWKSSWFLTILLCLVVCVLHLIVLIWLALSLEYIFLLPSPAVTRKEMF